MKSKGRWGESSSKLAARRWAGRGTRVLKRSPRARLQTTIELDPAKHYELHVSVIDATGMPSTCRRVLIEPPVSRGFDLKTILRAIGRFVAWLRARRR